MKQIFIVLTSGLILLSHSPIGAQELTLWNRFLSGNFFSVGEAPPEQIIEDNYIENKTLDAAYRESVKPSALNTDLEQRGGNAILSPKKSTEKVQTDIQTLRGFVTIESTK